MFSGIYHSCNAPAFLWVKMAGGGRCHEFFGHSEFAIHVRIRSNRNPCVKLTCMCGSTLRSCQSGTKSKWSSFQAADEPLLPPQLLPDVPESLKSIENQLQSEKKCIELGVSADQSIWIWNCVETLRQSQTRHQTRNGRGLSRNINHTLFRDGTFVEF